MRFSILFAGALFVSGLAMAPIHAQETPAKPVKNSLSSAAGSEDCFAGAITDMLAVLKQKDLSKDEIHAGLMRAVTGTLTPYICYLASEPVREKMLSDYEKSRQDKQPGAASGSSGSTSLASKGSSPSLLGFALEHGGLTQTTSGNTITFRGNLANSISALLKSSYLASYELSQKDALVRYLSRLSFGVSFDTSTNQPSTTQGFEPSGKDFSGFSAKYAIYDHRDPRHKEFRPQWDGLAATEGNALAVAIGELHDAMKDKRPKEWATWTKAAFDSISTLPTDATDKDLLKALEGSADLFEKVFANTPEIQTPLSQATARMSTYVDKEQAIVAAIRKTPIVTVEYNLTRQLQSNNQSIVSTQMNQKIPDLSNINLVLEKGFNGANAPELTFNAGGTWFNSPDSSSPKRGRFRDFSASAELDVPLKEIQNIGRPTLSFSGQFLALVNEPLGQQVMINGVTVTRTGNIGVFQTKVSIPIKDSGVKIPISFTYASRTELVKEADVRGNVGITFDLDSLFSKTK